MGWYGCDLKPDQPGDEVNIGLSGRYWVVPGELMAGPYPGAWDIEATHGGINGLLLAGIRHFVDLTQPGESAFPYPGIKSEQDFAWTHIMFPIPDMGLPSRDQMSRILDHLQDCQAQKIKVYVHCLGGLGRTGTVVGCFLVSQGMSGDQALERLSYLRRHTSNRWKSSPETGDQIQFVRNW